MAGVDPLFLELQTAVAGRYSLERELGRGGMGIVYLARDVSLDRLVALKLLPPELAERRELRERFLREARTAAGLSHPNIVPIHAVEESGRLVWFVMAFIPGESLGQRLRARGAMPPAEVTRVLRDIAWALAYAHTQGVVHRDVKPDNILLEAGGRRALIADFGIAAPFRREVGQRDSIIGTIAYLSPEQANGERVDGRSDLYGLGVVGYSALSSRLPYPVATLAELVERQVAGPPPPLSTVAPHLPRALARTIDRCLSPLPTARFQTGEELAEALEHVGGSSTDLPAPFRVWLARAERPRGTVMLISVFWGLPMLFGLLFAIARGAGEIGMLSIFSLAVGLIPWTFYGASRLMQTRRLLKVGYNQADIVFALQQHAERRHEELTFEYGTQSTRVGRLLRSAVFISVGVSAGSVLLAFITGADTARGLISVATGSVIAAGVLQWLRRLVPGSRVAPRDSWVEFALKVWRSRVGKWLTRIAGWGLQPVSGPEQLMHRPTEVALGDAAEALFRALPAAERRDLKNVPEQIRYLSSQAQAMRKKLEELDDLLAQASPDTLFGEDKPGGDGGAHELRSARELWAARLRETVTLLESLRVGLLKLHAGSAAPETLTADLDAARELKERLDRLFDAHGETDQLLREERS
ncbi:MAG: protein kinase [Gemmatimonadota bacterium]